MKAISLAFDVSSTKIPKLPLVYEYFGYLLCPANLVLGPFVTFSSYKSCHRSNKLSAKLLTQIALNSLLSALFIILSSCFLNYLISDNLKYVVVYRDALIFRCSHYFISFMSTATLLVSGIDSKMTSEWLGYQATKPLDIELPRSLIPVVVSWNIPIHLWVKTCELKCHLQASPFFDFLHFTFNFRRHFPQPEAVWDVQRNNLNVFDLIVVARSQFPAGCRSPINRLLHVRGVSVEKCLGGDIRCLRRCEQVQPRFHKCLHIERS